jgi:hypothetical protein
VNLLDASIFGCENQFQLACFFYLFYRA